VESTEGYVVKRQYVLGLLIFLFLVSFISLRKHPLSSHNNKEHLSLSQGKSSQTVINQGPTSLTKNQSTSIQHHAQTSKNINAPSDELTQLLSYSTRHKTNTRFGSLPWKPGMKWLVETHYLEMQHGTKPTWMSRPIVWEYHVRAKELLDGEDVYVVEVRAQNKSDYPYDPGGTIFISVQHHAIRLVHDRVMEQGEVRERSMRFEGNTNGSYATLFPTELPSPRRNVRKRKSHKGSLLPSPLESQPAATASLSSGIVIDVSFEVNGTRVRQRWDAANKIWPLTSRTASRMSFWRETP